eukprot:1157646-Pelagomonas_calceolata.AAC.15
MLNNSRLEIRVLLPTPAGHSNPFKFDSSFELARWLKPVTHTQQLSSPIIRPGLPSPRHPGRGSQQSNRPQSGAYSSDSSANVACVSSSVRLVTACGWLAIADVEVCLSQRPKLWPSLSPCPCPSAGGAAAASTAAQSASAAARIWIGCSNYKINVSKEPIKMIWI